MPLDGGTEELDMRKTRLEFSLAEIMEIVREAHQGAWENTISNIPQDDLKLKAFVESGSLDNFLKVCDTLHKRFVEIYNTKE